MIVVTRFNGPVFGLNTDLIERADANPDNTLVTLVDGKRYLIAEPLDELVRLIRAERVRIASEAALLCRARDDAEDAEDAEDEVRVSHRPSGAAVVGLPTGNRED